MKVCKIWCKCHKKKKVAEAATSHLNQTLHRQKGEERDLMISRGESSNSSRKVILEMSSEQESKNMEFMQSDKNRIICISRDYKAFVLLFITARYE